MKKAVSGNGDSFLSFNGSGNRNREAAWFTADPLKTELKKRKDDLIC
jgi:hypothetical protein